MAYKYKPNRKSTPGRYRRELKFGDMFPAFQGPLQKGKKHPCRCGCGEPLQGTERSWRKGHEATPLELYRLAKGDTGTIRKLVFERDKGVCARCQLDTVAAAESCRVWSHTATAEERAATQAHREAFMLLGYPPPDWHGKNWWQADHIKPVIEGGQHTMENLRTLCVVCHGKETDALAARRGRARRGVDRERMFAF